MSAESERTRHPGRNQTSRHCPKIKTANPSSQNDWGFNQQASPTLNPSAQSIHSQPILRGVLSGHRRGRQSVWTVGLRFKRILSCAWCKARQRQRTTNIKLHSNPNCRQRQAFLITLPNHRCSTTASLSKTPSCQHLRFKTTPLSTLTLSLIQSLPLPPLFSLSLKVTTQKRPGRLRQRVGRQKPPLHQRTSQTARNNWHRHDTPADRTGHCNQSPRKPVTIVHRRH